MIRSPILALLLATSTAHAAVDKIETSFTEERKGPATEGFLRGQRKSTNKQEASEAAEGSFIESAKATYLKYHNRVRVPGFISASPIPQLAKIIGPDVHNLSYRMGDTLYIRWSGAPLPKPGDRFATFTPAIVLQSLTDPTDFSVFDMPGPTTKLPEEKRMAGYMYETSGRIRIIKVENGIVHANVEALSGRLGPGDEIMQLPPLLNSITPINSGIQLSAAVVCGSPADRLSTTKRSFIYLNRGSRDGIRVGRVFESIEALPLDEAAGGAAPEVSNGEAIVVHVTDSYSTAIITKQFEVIRIGSLLRAKQEDHAADRNSPFQGYKDQMTTTKSDLKEIPSLSNLPGSKDESLPEPRKRPSAPALSELDELERSLNLKSLTPAERARLEKLSRQEKVNGARGADTEEDLADTPGAPTVENSFKEPKKPAKKEKKKKSSKNDEEELNLLMMQN
jgi:hypothetical protein